MGKKIIGMVVGLMFLSVNLFAAELTVELTFPQKVGKTSAPRPIAAPQKVNGNLLLDVTPYPTEIEAGRYLVEYYLNDMLIYSNNGFQAGDPAKLSFRYLLDTSKYPNGKYKLIVNFSDTKGYFGLAIKDIIIKNATN